MREFQLFREEDLEPVEPSGAGRAEEAVAILDGLNPPQREAAEATEGPLMIIAGAGSGKTRTLTYRIAYLLAAGRAKPWEVLALTFTNKAAREMKERITHLVGDEAARGLWMGTFHSMFARILRREAEKLGLTSDFSIYDTQDSERVVSGLMQQYNIDKKQFSPRSILSRISGAKNQLVAPDEYRRLAATPHDEKAALVYQPYVGLLHKSNALDFDDLLIRPIELFRKDAETLARYQRKWRYLLIDEYQDTNHAQYVLSKMLAAKHRNICVVGDDAQSIYAFRGADIKNILGFQRDYPEAKIVRLEQNYRSTQRILKLADSVIKQNQDQLEKTLWTDKQEGDYVTLFESLSERDEAQKVERTIRDIHLRHGLPYRAFAVLYRTNAQSRALEEALRRGGIPYQVVGGVTFYQRKEIKDALAYLRLVVNPSDAESLRRVINYPTRGIGTKTLERISDFAAAEGLTLWQAIERIGEVGLSSRARGAVEQFQFLIARYAARVESAPADELARDLIQETGILTRLREENTVESLSRWENVQELINGIAEFREQAEARGEAPTLGRFLQDVALLTDADKNTGDGNQVTLMTLHASKGLEFPVVFITGLEEGLFPLAAAAQDRHELEEERRLFYVGVTRAQEKLFLSYARSRFRYGRHQDSIRSRFLEEIDESVVRMASGAPHRARTGRFQDRGGGTASYSGVDPHYWRKESTPRSGSAARSAPDARSAPADENRRIVYDEGEAEIAPGVQVEHPQFGQGKVISIKGRGDRARAVVFFRDVGQKTLILKYARLQRIG